MSDERSELPEETWLERRRRAGTVVWLGDDNAEGKTKERSSRMVYALRMASECSMDNGAGEESFEMSRVSNGAGDALGFVSIVFV